MAIEESATAPVRRRRLDFNNFEEVLDEIESLHARPHRQLGNWSLPIITGHLALGIHGSIDGGTFPVPWHFKLLGPGSSSLACSSGFRRAFSCHAWREKS